MLQWSKFFNKNIFLLTNFPNITFFVIQSLTQLVKFFNSLYCTIILGIIQCLYYSFSSCIFKQAEIFRVASFSIVFSMRSWKSSIWSLSYFWSSFASLASFSAYFNFYFNFSAWTFNIMTWSEIHLIELSSISSLISSPLVSVFNSMKDCFPSEKLFTLVSKMQRPPTPVTEHLHSP